jgi:hypothetical protein
MDRSQSDEAEPRSRRSVLTAAVAAAAGAVLGGLGRPQPVTAAGETFRIGLTNDGHADRTGLIANAVGATLTSKNTNGSLGSTSFLAWSSATGTGATRAISARVDAANGYGVLARQMGAAGTGAAISADGGANNGVIATTDNAFRAAISATAPGRAIDASSTLRGVLVMRIDAPEQFADGLAVHAPKGNAISAYAPGGSGIGVYAEGGIVGRVGGAGTGVLGESPSGYAVYSKGHCRVTGDLRVTGAITQPYGSVTLDDPTNPAGSVLEHAHVASSERLTVYSGNVDLDAAGEAVVKLPAWFEALNDDVRYQLTPIGAAASLYVKHAVAKGRFTIAGGSAGLKVSWQLTARRKDAWSVAHPLRVQSPKRGKLKGRYLNPIEHGRSRDELANRVEYAKPKRHDEIR